jgi:Carboxypeptidase regulatory-like domain
MKKSRHSRLFVSVVPSIFWLALSVPAWAQKDTGSIVGTVKHGTGAVVPNADVQVTDVERGQPFTTTTSDSGEFVASPLRVGRYNVMVTKLVSKKLCQARWN